MNDTLYKIVYISRNAMTGADKQLETEIEHILATARHNNSQAQVTGALMFNAGRFAQVLEGPRDALEEVFERIQGDERHAQIVVMAFEALEQRSFSQWSMAYLGRCREAARRFADLTEATGLSVAQLSEERIHNLLKDHMMAAE